MKTTLNKFARVRYAKLYWKLLKHGGHLSVTYQPVRTRTKASFLEYIVTPL
jgi:hypothetical protein